MLVAMYGVMQEIPTENPPVFVALDLNNLPCLDLKNVDGASLICKQRQMKDELMEVKDEQMVMREQLASILNHLRLSATANDNQVGSAGQPTYAKAAGPATSKDAGRMLAVEPERGSSHREADTGTDARNDGATRPNASTPRGYIREADGFLRREKKQSRPKQFVTGKKTGTTLKAAPQQARVFVSRLDPSMTVESLQEFVHELTGSECVVEKIKPKYQDPKHSSFLIEVEKQYGNALMDPYEWEAGVIIRHFYGRYKRRQVDDGETESAT